MKTKFHKWFRRKDIITAKQFNDIEDLVDEIAVTKFESLKHSGSVVELSITDHQLFLKFSSAFDDTNSLAEQFSSAIKSNVLPLKIEAKLQLWHVLLSLSKIYKASYRERYMLERSNSRLINQPFLSSGISKVTGERFKLKIFSKTHLPPAFYQMLRNEAIISLQIDSEFCDGALCAWEDAKSICFVYEYWQHSNLHDWVLSKPRVLALEQTRELCTKFIVSQLISALDYLHTRSIIHRNVNLNNCQIKDFQLVSFQGVEIEVPTILLCDYSKAASSLPQCEGFCQVGFQFCNTAPEVMMGMCDVRSDVWSLGALTFLLLTGRPLFSGNSKEIFEATMKRDFVKIIENENFDLATNNFLKAALHFDHNTRPQAKSLRRQQWLREINIVSKFNVSLPLKTEICGFSLSELKSLFLDIGVYSPFEVIVRVLITYLLPIQNVPHNIRSLFSLLDQAHRSTVHYLHLHSFINMLLEGDLAAVERAIDKFNFMRTGLISRTAFFAMTLDFTKEIDQIYFKQVFVLLNPSRSGLITQEEFLKVFSSIDKINLVKDAIFQLAYPLNYKQFVSELVQKVVLKQTDQTNINVMQQDSSLIPLSV